MAIAYPFIGLIVERNPFIVFIVIGIMILFFTLLIRHIKTTNDEVEC